MKNFPFHIKRFSILSLFFILCSPNLLAKANKKDSIRTHIVQIEKLLSKKNYENVPEITQTLLIEKDKSVGIKKVNILLKLYNLSRLKSIQKAKYYNDEAIVLSNLINYEKGKITSRINNAYLHFVHADFNNCISELECIEIENKYIKYSDCYADLITLKSYIYTEKGEYAKALELGFNLLSYAEKINNNYAFMKAYSALSHYYLRTENFKYCLNYCLKTLELIIKLEKIQYIYPKIDEIARMTAKLNKPQKALKLYSFGIDVESKIQSTGSYIKSSVYLNMADIYLNIKEFENAQRYLSKALNLDYQNNYKFRIPRALQLKAKLNLAKNDTTKAISIYEQSLKVAEEINAFDVIKSNSLSLHHLYKETNNLSKAFEYNNIYYALSDSLFNNEKEQKIIILETRRKVAEITQMKEILELKSKVQNNKFHFAIVILILLSTICVIITISFVKTKQKNKLLYKRTIELVATQSKLKKIINEKTAISQVSQTKSLNVETSKLILHRLKTMEESHFYLNPNCNLNDISIQLRTNSKYLSQAINQEKKTNFNNYINDLRIEYLISKLWNDVDFRNSKLNYISASVGFNNINTFKNAFKKRQGILPLFFINELNKENNS